jgi:cytochrome P450
MNPNSFDHTRFLGENPNLIPAGAYIPFGAGVRSCPAEKMAVTEIALVISLLLDEFDVTVLNPLSQRVSRKPSSLLKPEVPVIAEIARRNFR